MSHLEEATQAYYSQLVDVRGYSFQEATEVCLSPDGEALEWLHGWVSSTYGPDAADDALAQ